MSTRKGSQGKGKKISKGAVGELTRKAGRRAPERHAHASSPKTKTKSK